MTGVAVLGATGSVGRSTLAVVRRHPARFRVVAMSVHRSVGELERLAAEFGTRELAVAESSALNGRPDLQAAGWRSGPEGVVELTALPGVDVVVNAVVGAAGLPPTLAALQAGKRCALANKESLVAAGELVLEAAHRGGGELVPVDSEHSAILQCIGSARHEEIHRLILTASGGPFRETGAEALKMATASMALRHPTWEMGAKITIDSATLANKALEVIEAHFLYGLPYERIEVVVHPTSIVHSFVEFVDGSVLSQMGSPTMELPILHALTWPRRPPDPVLRGFDPVELSPLVFEPVDEERFPHFRLGVNAGRAGAAAPAVFNAANEVAVEAFLSGRVTFLGMSEVVAAVLEALEGRSARDLQEVLQVDRAARRRAAAEVERIGA
ncbi:MAG: 1-deoxy-D-xylulose-5-phosphate reductoisomerase [Gemmatimonadetes bacterium]|nr:1-deoxy-D-xylulose-5-phosphate reductoisomerase [Gemmatimonadota bacterium]MYH51842.1 1-deoxy-D-xylulose-5-phosphate reductoisomerase [Gemmatimonadota bacterium]MYK66305.1 1-deoxy-D-xylulose-5-phosphate reductoisomerase [Gemmatimonadota bacterium]